MDLEHVPAVLQYAVLVGGAAGAAIFVFLILWVFFGEYFGLRADRAVKQMADLVGMKSPTDPTLTDAEIEHPSNLIALMKKVERALYRLSDDVEAMGKKLAEHIKDDRKIQRELSQNLTLTRKEIGLATPKKGRGR